MDTQELQAAIHQAVIDGDTEMVKQLNITLRRISHSTQAIDVPHQTVLRSTYTENNIQDSPKQITLSISAIICFGFLPYWAIAEVLSPGHQGLTKVTQASWGWGLSPLKGKLPTPKKLELEIPDIKPGRILDQKSSEVAPDNKTVVRSPEDVLITCGDHEGNPFVKFSLTGVDFFIYSVESCTPGVIKAGDAIAALTPASYMEVSDKGVITKKNRTELEQFFGG